MSDEGKVRKGIVEQDRVKMAQEKVSYVKVR